MCLSQAGRVTAVTDTEGLVDLDGIEKVVSLAPLLLDGRSVRPGDWVLVHAGLAMDLISESAGQDLADFSRLVRGGHKESDR